MMEDSELDVRALTRWLGPEGARAGLEACRALTIDTLRHLAEQIGCSISSKGATRTQIIDELVRYANRRIDKPLSVLLKMTEDEIVAYLERVSPAREELFELLREMKVAPTREGQKGLIRFAARELSETARFIDIASAGTSLATDDKSDKRESSRRTSDK